MTAHDYIRALDLAPHPEGGHYRETYRSADGIAGPYLPGRYRGGRPFCTAILFLLQGLERSRLHRLASDELWHYHDGDTIHLVLIAPNGERHDVRVGPDIADGEVLQAVIPAGWWFGGAVVRPDGFTLVSCTVAPGFDFDDFELADRDRLIETFPQHREVIERLT